MFGDVPEAAKQNGSNIKFAMGALFETSGSLIRNAGKCIFSHWLYFNSKIVGVMSSTLELNLNMIQNILFLTVALLFYFCQTVRTLLPSKDIGKRRVPNRLVPCEIVAYCRRSLGPSINC